MTSSYDASVNGVPYDAIDHPEFYDRYRAVGNFPECEDPGTVIKTMIFKAMVGWATPLM